MFVLASALSGRRDSCVRYPASRFSVDTDNKYFSLQLLTFTSSAAKMKSLSEKEVVAITSVR